MRNLNSLFSPKSIAVIGASNTKGKVGHDIFSNILQGGFTGVLYPVNPNNASVCSVRAYRNILDIEDTIDLAIIILPPRLAEIASIDAINKKVNSIVIVSAGFKEVDTKGAEIENKIAYRCKEANVNLVGPNCLGIINPISKIKMNASFSARMPSSGNVSFISQSGALCSAVLDFATHRNFGFSKFISIGNKADINELDLLKYLHTDPYTEVIMLYLEELNCGSEFIEIVAEITGGENPKPVLAVKSGKTTAGAEAAASHTGSISGSDDVYEAIFAQSGIIRVNSIEELFDFGIAFAFKNETAVGKLKRKVPNGNRIGIVTNAGGPGIVATDMTVSSGLKLAQFDKKTIHDLKAYLPSTANINNPVDIIGDAAEERYFNSLLTVIRDNNVDAVLVILTPQSMTDAIGTAKTIVKISSRSYKPIICCFMGIIDVSEGVKYLQSNGIPVYPFPESATKALGALYKYSKWLNRIEYPEFEFEFDKKRALSIVEKAICDGDVRIREIESLELLKCYGFNTLPSAIAENMEDAVSAASSIGFPIAMKIVSDDIVHKTDVGGVILNVRDEKEVRKNFEDVVKNAMNYSSKVKIKGVLIQKISSKGQEVILGMNRYNNFGPLIMFGTGGIFVDIFKDVAFRFAPLNLDNIRFMLRSTAGYKILTGFRGLPSYDIKAIEKMIMRLSKLVINHPEILEIDINPLIVHQDGMGATVADVRFILKRNLNKIV